MEKIPSYHAIDETERVIGRYVEQFIENNSAARFLAQELNRIGVGFRPVADHITVRTKNVLPRAQEFLSLGFHWDNEVGDHGLISFDDWWARVLRKPGFPAIFIDQAYEGERGKTSIIPGWVDRFGDKILHHVAVIVDDIEASIAQLAKQGIRCSGEIVGGRGSDLRQIFTEAQVRDGHPFTVLELAERHHGYAGFLPPQAAGLMKSSTQMRNDEPPRPA